MGSTILGTESPAKGASQVGQLLLAASLAAFMVTQLPKTVQAVAVRLPAASRVRAVAALRAGYRIGGSYARRTLALGGACAVGGGLIAGGCGVPGAAVVGLWLGMWSLVPKLGIVVGGLPLVALAAGQGTVQLVAATLGLGVVVAVGEWSRWRWIERRTIKVGAFLSLVALMVGVEFGRWPGALVALVGISVLLAGADASGTLSAERVEEPAPVAPAAAEAVVIGAEPRRVLVDIDPQSLVLTGVVVLSLVVGVGIIRSVPQALTRLGVGVLVALALNPVVGVVHRRLHFNRQAAVSFVVGGFLASVVAFSLFAVPRAIVESRQLSVEVPKVVAQLDRAPMIGKVVRGRHLDARIRSFLDDLPHLLATHDKAISGAARSAGESLLAVCWMVLVLAAALLDGPAVAAHAKRAVPRQRRPRAEDLGNRIYQAVGRSAAGSTFAALLQGAVVLVIAVAFGLPLSPLLAANAAFWAFVPQVGGFMAAAPLVLVGLTEGLGTAFAVGLLFVAWMVFDNHVLHPVIVGRAAGISPLGGLVAVLLGGALGRPGGCHGGRPHRFRDPRRGVASRAGGHGGATPRAAPARTPPAW